MNASLLVFYLGLAASYLLIRPVATLVHEGGHVLALRLLGMPGEIHVFVGSLGNARRAWCLRIGRILWMIDLRIFFMRGSRTDYRAPLGAVSLCAYALAGPLASAAMALGVAALALSDATAGPWRAVLILACLLPSIDVLLALLHRYQPVPLSNARITANDGQLLGWALRYRKDVDTYLHARWLFEKDDYAAASAAIQSLLQVGHREKLLYEYWIYAELMERRPLEALQAHAALLAQHDPDAFDDCLLALALAQLGRPVEARAAIDAALAKAPGNHEALNLHAWEAMQQGDWTAARADLDRAIRSHAAFAAAWAHRGMVQIALGNLEFASSDLQAGMLHDHENPWVHFYASILHLQQGDRAAASSCLASARLLGLRLDDLRGPICQIWIDAGGNRSEW